MIGVGFTAVTLPAMPSPPPESLMPVVVWVVSLYGLLFFAGLPLFFRFVAAEGLRGLVHPERMLWLKTRAWSPLDALGILAVLLGINLTLSLGYSVLQPLFHWRDWSEQAWLVIQSIAFHWMGFLLMILWAQQRGFDLHAAFSLPRHRTRESLVKGLGFLTGAMPVVILSHVVFFIALVLAGIPIEAQDVTRVIAATDHWVAKGYFVLLGVVIAPIVEEMLFRGILLPALASVVHPVLAMVGTSLLFALFHANLLSFAVLFMLSMALSCAMIQTRNLGVSIVMHALFNAIPMTALVMGGFS